MPPKPEGPPPSHPEPTAEQKAAAEEWRSANPDADREAFKAWVQSQHETDSLVQQPQRPEGPPSKRPEPTAEQKAAFEAAYPGVAAKIQTFKDENADLDRKEMGDAIKAILEENGVEKPERPEGPPALSQKKPLKAKKAKKAIKDMKDDAKAAFAEEHPVVAEAIETYVAANRDTHTEEEVRAGVEAILADAGLERPARPAGSPPARPTEEEKAAFEIEFPAVHDDIEDFLNENEDTLDREALHAGVEDILTAAGIEKPEFDSDSDSDSEEVAPATLAQRHALAKAAAVHKVVSQAQRHAHSK